MPDGDSFLPRIQSVFYAVFDVKQGPKIVCQVPEDLIAVSPPGPSVSSASVPPTPATQSPSILPQGPAAPKLDLTSRGSSVSLASPSDSRSSSNNISSKRLVSSPYVLFHFDDISKYVIPPRALCGRLIICSTKRHRIIGCPVRLWGMYKRNYFVYNLCFVFEREADLSCYEPIVRKVSRVLTACETEWGFLTSPERSQGIPSILEQLYEDLNSYSETSISVDMFNTIELKIFPFYPNPPDVKDWMVPLALINLAKRIEDNWDLTMTKVCKFIDGTNHVSRIAHLADCDISLTRQAIAHLLYYQVIMTIDIFQYSNMYTLCKSIQWLADETHVKDECGPYVTKSGKPIPEWPKLLHLYSRLKPGKTVLEWMELYEVDELGIDIRRFTSFGVIKGFLRRIHRWPVYIPPEQTNHLSFSQLTTFDTTTNVVARARGKSLSATSTRHLHYHTPPDNSFSAQNGTNFPSLSPDQNGDVPADSLLNVGLITPMTATHRARRASAAEKILEQLRSRDMHKSGVPVLSSSPKSSWFQYPQPHQQKEESPSNAVTPTLTSAPPLPTPTAATHELPTRLPGRPESRRQSLITPAVPPSSPVMPKPVLTPSRPRPLKGSSAPHLSQRGTISAQINANQPFPPDLVKFLDGEHHTDELAVKFEAGWPLLEHWLTVIGGGTGENGDYGRVLLIYR